METAATDPEQACRCHHGDREEPYWLSLFRAIDPKSSRSRIFLRREDDLELTKMVEHREGESVQPA